MWPCGTASTGSTRLIEGVKLGLLGRHNVSNALAAVAIAREIGIGDAVVREALAGLQGVKRRFTKTGVVAGITVIDDYGHHPEEIRAVLRTARAAAPGRVIAVVQPHRYSRLQGLLEEFCTCFGDADTVVVAPVYAAGEAPIAGIDREALVRGLRAHGQRDVRAIEGPEDLAALVQERGPGGRLRRLPRCREHQPVGQRPAGGASRAPGQGERRMTRTARELPEVRGTLRTDVPLAPLTWLRVGGPAAYRLPARRRRGSGVLSCRARSGPAGAADGCGLEPARAGRRLRRGGRAVRRAARPRRGRGTGGDRPCRRAGPAGGADGGAGRALGPRVHDRHPGHASAVPCA